MSSEAQSAEQQIWTPDLESRLEHLDRLGHELNLGSYAALRNVKPVAIATVTPDETAMTYRLSSPRLASLDLAPWSSRLGDFLFNARSLMDNVMWNAVHADPVEALTESQLRQTYFPIASTRAQWRSYAGRPEVRALRPDVRQRIEAVQPFRRPNERTSAAMQFMNRLHRDDKHRQPLRLTPILDPQWPALFDIRPRRRPHEAFMYPIEWANAGVPLMDGMTIAEVQANRALKTPRRHTRLTLALVATLEGREYDLQDLIWDVEGAVLRVLDVVGRDDTTRPDTRDVSVAFERDRLEAFNRSLLTDTNEWSEKYASSDPLTRLRTRVARAIGTVRGGMRPLASTPAFLSDSPDLPQNRAERRAQKRG